jgi:hypothetical protein
LKTPDKPVMAKNMATQHIKSGNIMQVIVLRISILHLKPKLLLCCFYFLIPKNKSGNQQNKKLKLEVRQINFISNQRKNDRQEKVKKTSLPLVFQALRQCTEDIQ